MLVTKQPFLRRSWNPVIKSEDLQDGPHSFRLLGIDLVLWRNREGVVSAVHDRCCHRSAKLSLGWVDADCVVCPYHGWKFDGNGRCRSVPQAGDRVPNAALRVHAFPCQERYGYVWVKLSQDEDLFALPEFEEHDDPAFRQIHEFYEVWNCASLRLMENSFDAAHVAFVHRNSFGDITKPIPNVGDITKLDGRFFLFNKNRVDNSKVDRSVTASDEEFTYRTTRTDYFPPFVRKSKIHYPNGLIHSIVTCATPIDDGSMQLCQWVYRNDTEGDVPAGQRQLKLPASDN